MSWEPKVDADGFRYYGKWAGNPRGNRENKTRCIVCVSGNIMHGEHPHQCTKPRGKGPDGLYCTIHDPAYVEKKSDDINARWAAKRRAEGKPYRDRSRMEHALRLIADGHNDPRLVAKLALEQDEDRIVFPDDAA